MGVITDKETIVHFANSAHLLDMLTQSQVRGFRFRMFTDRFVYPSLPQVRLDG